MNKSLSHFTAPAPTAAPAGKAGKATAPAPKVATAATLTKAVVDRLHAAFAAAGETCVVLGMNATRTEAVRVVLDPCNRVARDGSLSTGEWAAVTPVTGAAATLRRSTDGRSVSHGWTVPAPTAGKAVASRAAWAIILGDGVDGPQTVSLTGETSGRTDRGTVKMSDGATLSLDVSVRVPKRGDAWTVTARIFAGGKLPDSDSESLALAALDAGEAGEAAVIDAAAILTGAMPVKATRAAGKRASVATAKRAARK